MLSHLCRIRVLWFPLKSNYLQELSLGSSSLCYRPYSPIRVTHKRLYWEHCVHQCSQTLPRLKHSILMPFQYLHLNALHTWPHPQTKLKLGLWQRQGFWCTCLFVCLFACLSCRSVWKNTWVPIGPDSNKYSSQAKSLYKHAGQVVYRILFAYLLIYIL